MFSLGSDILHRKYTYAHTEERLFLGSQMWDHIYNFSPHTLLFSLSDISKKFFYVIWHSSDFSCLLVTYGWYFMVWMYSNSFSYSLLEGILFSLFCSFELCYTTNPWNVQLVSEPEVKLPILSFNPIAFLQLRQWRSERERNVPKLFSISQKFEWPLFHRILESKGKYYHVNLKGIKTEAKERDNLLWFHGQWGQKPGLIARTFDSWFPVDSSTSSVMDAINTNCLLGGFC